MPIANDEVTQDVKNFVTDLNLSAITDEFVHGTFFTNFVLEGVNKFVLMFHTVAGGVFRVKAKIQLN
ncbi:MAG: hypothetical protein AAFP02_26010, partial [Bacteroidota bacterium]